MLNANENLQRSIDKMTLPTGQNVSNPIPRHIHFVRPHMTMRGLVLSLVLAALSAACVGQTVLVTQADLSSKSVFGHFFASSAGNQSLNFVTLNNDRFKDAIRVQVGPDLANFYSAQFYINSTCVASGHILMLSFSVKKLTNPGVPLKSNINYLTNNDIFQRFGFPCDKSDDWCDYRVPIRSPANVPCYSRTTFYYGLSRSETFLVANISLIDYGPLNHTQWMALKPLFYYPDRGNATAAWRVAANERIAQHRTSQVTVTVVDKNNQPLEGAVVSVQQTNHSFPFGAGLQATNFYTLSGYRDKFYENFNAAVIQNDLKWLFWEKTPANQNNTLNVVKELYSRGIYIRGHNLLYPRYASMPPDIPSLNASQVHTRIVNHFKEIINVTYDYIKEWDVINEPFTCNVIQGVVPNTVDLAQTDGTLGNQFAVEAYNLAASLTPPDTLLYVNENVFVQADPTVDQYNLDFAKWVQQNGGKLTGYGLESHVGGNLRSIGQLDDMYQAAAAALPSVQFAVTEYDSFVLDEDLQADYLEDYLTYYFSQPKVNKFILWDFAEVTSAQPEMSLWRKDWSIKPNGARWRELVFNRWWTLISNQVSDSRGQVSAAVFLGHHTVQVSYTAVNGTVLTQQLLLSAVKNEASAVSVKFDVDAPVKPSNPNSPSALVSKAVALFIHCQLLVVGLGVFLLVN